MMSIRDILGLLFKRKRLIIAFFASSLIAGYLGLKYYPAQYESSSSLMIRLGQEDIYMPVLQTSQFRTPVMSSIREEQVRSETGILESVSLAEQVVDKLSPAGVFPGIDDRNPWYTPKGVLQMAKNFYFGMEHYFFPGSQGRTIREQATSRLQSDLSVTALKNTNVVEVKLRNYDPQIAANTLNVLIDLYLQERIRIYQREQVGFYRQQNEQLEFQLQQAEQRVEAMRKGRQVIDVEGQRAAFLKRLEEIYVRIDELSVASSESGNRIGSMRAQLAMIPPTIQLSSASSANSYSISEMNKQLTDLRRKEAEIIGRYSENAPQLEPVRREMRAVEKMIAENRNIGDQSVQEGINPLYARISDEILQNETLYASQNEALARWRDVEIGVRSKLDDLNSQEAEYTRLLQTLDVLRQTRKLYLEKIEETRFQSAQADASISSVSIINRAVPNHRPVTPKLWLVLIGILVVGVAGSVSVAFIAEILDDAIHSERDVYKYMGLPVLAKMPSLTEGGAPPYGDALRKSSFVQWIKGELMKRR